MNLLLWLLIGLIINILLHKHDPSYEKDSLLGAGVVIVLRSVSGGIVSNYVFNAGLGGIDPITFTYLGLMPLMFLVIGRVFYKQLT